MVKLKNHKAKIFVVVIIVYLIIAGLVFINDKYNNKEAAQGENESQSVEKADNKVDTVNNYDLLTANLTYDLATAKMPILKTDCESIISQNNLPALERMSEEDTTKYMSNLQVLKKIQDLGIDTKTFETPEFNWKNLYNEVYNEIEKNVNYSSYITFEGTKASELNSLIEASENTYITLESHELVLDETIKLKSGIGINGKKTTFTAQGVDKAFLIENCSNVTLDNIHLVDGGYAYGIYAVKSTNFVVSDCAVEKAGSVGMVVLGENKNFVIRNNVLRDNTMSGMFFGENVSQGVFEGNTIEKNRGASNFGAGMIMAAMKYQSYDTPYITFEDNYLYDMGDAPHDIVIYHNVIQWNNSSGIYSCGGYENYIVNNTFYRNDKEGMCLDYGTFGVYVSNNTVKENGGRYRQTDADLKDDFIFELGRMSDGSSPAKLPGISLDNAAYNILAKNDIDDNYGDGIKTVRSAYRNIILANVVGDNNIGQNDMFHFFGVDIGFASKPDEPVKGLDFTPSYENVICRNTISGDNYSGIHLADGSYCNDVFDNVVMDASKFAIENHSIMFNSIMNNNADKGNLDVYLEQTSGKKK